MWYEQIGAGVITWACIAGALYISGPANLLDVGRWYRRDTATEERCILSKRDHRLTGNQYRISGLDSIKDE
ncbi:Protein F31D4.9 [Aphelenchoides avenae]|nr:Protein F31D4.9 [Aphelenchus avenae]